MSPKRQRRGERVAAVTALLYENPGRLFTLGELADRLGAARSSLSEDLAVIRQAVSDSGLGRVVTTPGASGGVRFLPAVDAAGAAAIVSNLCRELSDPRRVLAGGYIYMTDLIFSPHWAGRLGRVFALLFSRPAAGGRASSSDAAPASPRCPAAEADCVVTVETKGIPLALMTARCLGLPLIVARRDLRVTEGSSLSINYASGSTGDIQTMSLPRRALEPGARVLVVDDFMKAGGTTHGLMELMAEFGATVLSVGILTATAVPARKLVSDYLPLTVLAGIDERRRLVKVAPGPALATITG